MVAVHDLVKRLTFLQEIEKLKTIHRANRTLDAGRAENSAEHSWHLAMYVLVLKDYVDEPVDLARVVKMVLLHDIVEIDAGDTWLFAENQQDKTKTEDAAAQRIFGLLPEKDQQDFYQTWLAFEARQCAESRFAAVIDGLQPLLNHLQTGDPAETNVSIDIVLAKKAFIQNYTPRLWPVVLEMAENCVAKGLFLPSTA